MPNHFVSLYLPPSQTASGMAGGTRYGKLYQKQTRWLSRTLSVQIPTPMWWQIRLSVRFSRNDVLTPYRAAGVYSTWDVLPGAPTGGISPHDPWGAQQQRYGSRARVYRSASTAHAVWQRPHSPTAPRRADLAAARAEREPAPPPRRPSAQPAAGARRAQLAGA